MAQADREILRETGAAEDELVRAMMRNGRRHRRAHQVAVEGPAGEGVADRRDRRIAGRETQRRDLVAQCHRHRLGEARDRLEEGAVGDHRRDHRPHSKLGIGGGDRRHAFACRHRPLEQQVVASGAALHHHFGRADLGRQTEIIELAIAVNPQRCGGDIASAISHPWPVAWSEINGRGETGMNETATGVDLRFHRRGDARRADLRIVSPSIRMSASSAVPARCRAPSAARIVKPIGRPHRSLRHRRLARCRPSLLMAAATFSAMKPGDWWFEGIGPLTSALQAPLPAELQPRSPNSR